MSKRDQNTEDFLFDSIRTGNIEAYEVLFKKYYLSMCIVACRLVGDEDIAKDIAQEVFIHLWEKRESYNFETTPDIFICSCQKQMLRLFEEAKENACSK